MKKTISILAISLLAFSACQKDAKMLNGNTSMRAADAIVAPFTTDASAITVSTFNGQYLDAGNNPSGNYVFPDELKTASISRIIMSVKLGTHADQKLGTYDVFARINANIKDPADSSKTISLELGRFITPFGKDNSSLPNGFEIDVTDFKSVLMNTVSLSSFAESYSGGWALNVSFKFEKGTPDYKYYAIAPVLNYGGSAQLISFGSGAVGSNITGFKTNHTLKVPSNAAKTAIRTIITGWGSASPFLMINGVRSGYAEFAYTTHHININNGEDNFETYMGPLGCGGTNKDQVQDQLGTWLYQRAGWCPGMSVPVRSNVLTNAHAGASFDYQFNFQNDWVNDNQHGAAYFALTSYVVVKSDTPIAFASDYIQ